MLSLLQVYTQLHEKGIHGETAYKAGIEPMADSEGEGVSTVLEAIGEGIWLTEGEIVSFHGFPFPTRSVIVRFDDGALWVWSPVKLTEALRRDVDGLGRVAHLVSPNKLHHLYLGEWKAAFPAAKLWGPASSIAKRRDLSFEPSLKDNPPSAWQGCLDQAWFRGSPVMDEIVFFHHASRTAILADLIESFTDQFLREHWTWWQRPLARLDGITLASSRAPLEWRLSFIDRAPARAARDKMLSWNCHRVVMAHGEWQRTNGHAFLRRSFEWVG